MIEFLKSLAPEGETFLIVKQMPTKAYHGDGTPKYVWPAMMPDKWRGPAAWYGNTASFIVNRFKGRISASSANAEHVLVLILDDVGTKSKLPPLKPTWIIETSPGNYQYGYVFSIQPTLAEYSAAIIAIAAAGYTDVGAINPVRNFRLPGSLNLKAGNNNFAARLVEFNQTIEYTLAEICHALNVVPDDPNTTKFQRMHLTDNGMDDVLGWLSTRGAVVDRGNTDGWYGVVCPNAHEHSDGQPAGRYQPVNRAYCCFHSHCGDWDSTRFLNWVAAEGGPKHEHGLRDDLLAGVMTTALSKLTPNTLFTDEAKVIVQAAEQRETGRLDKTEWWDRFAYVQSDDGYFDLNTRREITRSSFNAIFRHVPCNSIHNNRKVEASVCFDENRRMNDSKVLVGVTYAAGEPVIVPRDGELYGNRWTNARPKPVAGDMSRWLAHCESIIPEKFELEHIYDVMAFKVQHPNIKINHAILHGSVEGSGKDTMWGPFLWAVAGPSLQNRGMLNSATINSQFDYQLECEVLLINELKEPNGDQRRQLANKLKPLIAAPPDTLIINRKSLAPYQMINRLFVLAFTNEHIPITLSGTDRRWFCVWSHTELMAPERARSMWSWYRTGGGFEAIADWLHKRDVSKFNPAAAPPMTEYKANMLESGMSTAESVLVDMMRKREGEFSKGAVGSPFHAVCARIANAMPVGVKVPQAALFHAFQEAGWKDMGRLMSAELTTKRHIFAAPELRYISKSDLRRLVEDTPVLAPVVQLAKRG